MKKLKNIMVSFLLLFGITACGVKDAQGEPLNKATATNEKKGEPLMNTIKKRKILVAYFSATGTTETLAKYMAEILSVDIYEIIPEVSYTKKDLAYYTNGRADKEQKDSNSRPKILGSNKNIEHYDTVLIGYPIWHGQAPKIISTFLESYDFEGKTIIPFCTSHSSGIGSSDSELHILSPKALWQKGQRFSKNSTKTDVTKWLKIIGLEDSKSM